VTGAARADRATSLPRRILVVRLGAIGDVVNATCFAAAVKRQAPDTEIGWVVHPVAQPLVDGHPCIDRVHVWRRKSGLRGLRELARELRAQRYELAVDLQRIAKSSLLARLSGAPRVLGYDRRRAKECSWLLTRERVPAGDPRAHMIDQYLEFARYLGIPRPIAEHRWPKDPGARRWAEQVVRESAAPLVLINLGASKPENQWPAKRFGAVAAGLLRDPGCTVCLTGGPDDRPRADVALSICGPNVRDLVGATDLLQLAELCARARLVVSCDTGPMHMAVAAGAEVLGLFGPADACRTGPFGAQHRVLSEPPFVPSASFVPARMEDLSVERVLQVARARLAETGSG
jgi:heptosyltransferase-1